ncbi:MAG: hypothetical protein V3W41_19315 [Planctomycetota bacterium]
MDLFHDHIGGIDTLDLSLLKAAAPPPSIDLTPDGKDNSAPEFSPGA